jgi:hypothetical protein
MKQYENIFVLQLASSIQAKSSSTKTSNTPYQTKEF